MARRCPVADRTTAVVRTRASPFRGGHAAWESHLSGRGHEQDGTPRRHRYPTPHGDRRPGSRCRGAAAAARRRRKVVEELLRLGADPNIRDDSGNTPLHTALDKGCDIEVFTLLVKHGASPDIPGKDARTVRDIASRKRDKRYAAALETVGGRHG
jgi:Ankyrin repeats (many copies)